MIGDSGIGEMGLGQSPAALLLAYTRALAYVSDLEAAQAEPFVAVELDVAEQADPDTIITKRWATESLTTAGDDTPPDTAILGVVTAARVLRGLTGDSTGATDGLIRVAGEVELGNADGVLDPELDGWTPDGRRLTLRASSIGRAGDGRRAAPRWGDTGAMLVGYASQWAVSLDQVRIEAQGLGQRLNRPVQRSTYAGTGGLLEGPPALKGVTRPHCYGHAINVPPQLVDWGTQIHDVHYQRIRAVDAVRDRGAAYPFSGLDLLTRDALAAATIPAGTWATCLAAGCIRLGWTPAGLITADVRGDGAAPAPQPFSDGTFYTDGTGHLALSNVVYVDTVAGIVTRLLRVGGELAASEINATLFRRADAQQPGLAGLFLPAGGSDTVETVMARVARSAGMAVGTGRTGKVEIWLIEAPLPTSTYTIDHHTQVDRARGALQEAPPPWGAPPWRLTATYRPNWAVQPADELALGLDPDLVADLSQPSRRLIVETPAIKTARPSSGEAVIETLFVEEAVAQAELERRAALMAPGGRVFRLPLKSIAQRLTVGRTVKLVAPRDLYGLRPGRNCIVTGIEESLVTREVDVELLAVGSGS